MNTFYLFPKGLALVLSVILACGCSEDPMQKKTLVEFEAMDRVRIEGRSFPLKTEYDSYEIRKEFYRSRNFSFANIEKTDYRKLWLFAYMPIPRNVDFAKDFPRSFVAAHFYVKDTDTGRQYSVKFGSRSTDLERVHLPERRKRFVVDPAGRRPERHDLSEINAQSVKDTYLELLCDRELWGMGHPVSGKDILEVLRCYYRYAGRDAEAYLVPFECDGDSGQFEN